MNSALVRSDSSVIIVNCQSRSLVSGHVERLKVTPLIVASFVAPSAGDCLSCVSRTKSFNNIASVSVDRSSGCTKIESPVSTL